MAANVDVVGVQNSLIINNVERTVRKTHCTYNALYAERTVRITHCTPNALYVERTVRRTHCTLNFKKHNSTVFEH